MFAQRPHTVIIEVWVGAGRMSACRCLIKCTGGVTRGQTFEPLEIYVIIFVNIILLLLICYYYFFNLNPKWLYTPHLNNI